jgi:hypothetical protein
MPTLSLLTLPLLSILLFLAPSTHSHPHPPPWTTQPWSACLTDADATFLANIYTSFSVSFDPNYAGQFLADDFTLQSDSANILFGLPVRFPSHFIPSLTSLQLGTPTATNKTAFLAGALVLTTSSTQSPVTMENVIHSCTEIALRYVTADTPPIRGIDILYTGVVGGVKVLESACAEFDNVADLVGRGLWPCA